MCGKYSKYSADIVELEAQNSALAAEIDKLSTQNNILKRPLRMRFDPPNQSKIMPKSKLKCHTVKNKRKPHAKEHKEEEKQHQQAKL